MTTQDLTVHQAREIAETHPDLTPKERQKILAIAYHHQCKDNPLPFAEMEVLWHFSQLVSPYPIPDFDPDFIKALNATPELFKTYK